MEILRKKIEDIEIKNNMNFSNYNLHSEIYPKEKSHSWVGYRKELVNPMTIKMKINYLRNIDLTFLNNSLHEESSNSIIEGFIKFLGINVDTDNLIWSLLSKEVRLIKAEKLIDCNLIIKGKKILVINSYLHYIPFDTIELGKYKLVQNEGIIKNGEQRFLIESEIENEIILRIKYRNLTLESVIKEIKGEDWRYCIEEICRIDKFHYGITIKIFGNSEKENHNFKLSLQSNSILKEVLYNSHSLLEDYRKVPFRNIESNYMWNYKILRGQQRFIILVFNHENESSNCLLEITTENNYNFYIQDFKLDYSEPFDVYCICNKIGDEICIKTSLISKVPQNFENVMDKENLTQLKTFENTLIKVEGLYIHERKIELFPKERQNLSSKGVLEYLASTNYQKEDEYNKRYTLVGNYCIPNYTEPSYFKLKYFQGISEINVEYLFKKEVSVEFNEKTKVKALYSKLPEIMNVNRIYKFSIEFRNLKNDEQYILNLLDSNSGWIISGKTLYNLIPDKYIYEFLISPISSGVIKIPEIKLMTLSGRIIDLDLICQEVIFAFDSEMAENQNSV